MSRGLRFPSAETMPSGVRAAVERQQQDARRAPAAKPKLPARVTGVRRDQEHVEQAVFFQRLACLAINEPRYALAVSRTFAIPNGGGRSKREAGRLKAEGVKAGVSDVHCAFPNGEAHGLWIEMKRPDGGRTSSEQREWIETSEALGYVATVAHGADAAMKAWREYVDRAPRARLMGVG